MVERMMLTAGADLAMQAYMLMEQKIRRLKQMQKNYPEQILEIEEDLAETTERLASIRHVLEMRGVKLQSEKI